MSYEPDGSMGTADQVFARIQGGEWMKLDEPWKDPEAFKLGLAEAERILGEPQTALIGGEPVGSEHHFSHHNPNTGEAFAPNFVTSAQDLDRAVAIASGDNPTWSDPDNLAERVAVADRFTASLVANRFVLDGLMTLSQGKNDMEAWRDGQELRDFGTEYRRVGEFLKFLRNEQNSNNGETTSRPDPVGVVGVWAPFNFTCIGGGEALAALIMGNSVVFHPSPRNIAPYRYLAELMLEAGVPEDRLQFIVPDSQDFSLSQNLVADTRIDQISFTGSHRVALSMVEANTKKILRTGKLDYHVDMESGGRNPIIVAGLPGGDLDYTIEKIVDSMIGYQGQKCSALGELLIVGDTLGREVTDALVARLEQVRIRPTIDPDSDMGALIDMKALKTIEEQLGRVVQDGGRIITGGRTHSEISGALVPTLYDGLPLDSQMANVEIFGPAAQVRVVGSVDEAVTRANGMGYRLTAGVMAPDIEEAHRIVNRLRHGVTYSNDGSTAAPVRKMPFGGSGRSGSGTLLKPGSAGHPLQFTRMRSVAMLPRNEWEKVS